MVLYHAINTYQILNCMLHALMFHADEKRIIFLPSFIKRNIPQYSELKSLGFFNDIILFNYSKYNGKDEEYIYNNLDGDIDEALYPYVVLDFSEIYLGAAHYYLSVYLISHNISFSIMEDGAGLLSRHKLLEETIRNQHVLNVTLLEKNKLFDLSNSCIKKKICITSVQEDGFDDPLMENFNVIQSLAILEMDWKKKILYFWKCPKPIKCNENSVLLLTQNFANLNQLSFSSQILIYQILKDFFIRNSGLIIKPHPNDLMYYEKLFPNAVVIKEKFPSELLPFVFERIPKTISTISSTGINLLKDQFRDSIVFDVTFEKIFRLTGRYYVALFLIKYMGIDNFYIKGCHSLLIDNLVALEEFQGLVLNAKGKTLIIGALGNNEVSEISKLLKEYETIFFLNSDESYCFIEEIPCSSMIPIQINKTKKREEDNYYDLEPEYIYVYCNSEVGDKVKNFEFKCELEECGVALNICKMTDEEIYIKTLEGQIRALEKRLLYYIEKDEGGVKE